MLTFPCVLGIVKIVRAHFSIWYFLTFAAYSIWTGKIKLKMWKSSQMSRLFSRKSMSHLSFILCFNIGPSLTLSLWFLPVSFVFLVLIDPLSIAVVERRKEMFDYCWVFAISAYGEVISNSKICSRVGWGKTFVVVGICWFNGRGTLKWEPQNT